MADNNKLELIVEVDVNKANASIKSVNTGLSSMEPAASKAAHGASAGIDGMTASMVKGAAAGNLIAESIKKALEWAKEWTIEAANDAAHTDKMGMSMVALAKAHGVAEEAAKRSVEGGQESRLLHRGRDPRGRPAHDRGHEPVEGGGAGEGRQGRRCHRELHAWRHRDDGGGPVELGGETRPILQARQVCPVRQEAHRARRSRAAKDRPAAGPSAGEEQAAFRRAR